MIQLKSYSTLRNPAFFQIAIILILFMPLDIYAKEWKYLEQTKIQWRDYGETAFIEAKTKGKLLYVLIYADWCHWCKKFEKETLETDLVRTLIQEKMIPVAVDNVALPEIGRRLSAKLVPTSIILAPNGQSLLRFSGFLPANELDGALRSTLLRWRKGEFEEDEFGDESTCCPVR